MRHDTTQAWYEEYKANSRLGVYLECGNARGRVHIEELESLVQRARYQLITIVAELDHLHGALMAALRFAHDGQRLVGHDALSPHLDGVIGRARE
jgi:hypothetical protein